MEYFKIRASPAVLMRTDIYISPISDIQYTESLQTTLVLATGRAEASAQLANLFFFRRNSCQIF